MTTYISIIGLKQVGASIGLALAAYEKDYYRAGYDRNVLTGQQAVKEHAIEKSFFNLPSAVEKADYVVLAVPAFELKAALDVIGPVLKEGAVVLDTSPFKKTVEEWAARSIPAGRWFVSISPTLNPSSFSDSRPSADLFRNSLMVITAGAGVPEEVIERVISLAGLLGAQTQFSDPLEYDGQTAAVRQLPAMAAAALLHAVADQPGWLESRKLAGSDFASASAALQDLAELEEPAHDLFHNQANALRVLDNLIASLTDLRDQLSAKQEKEVNEFFARASQARKEWLEQRQGAEWERKVETPQPPDLVTRLLGGRGKPVKK